MPSQLLLVLAFEGGIGILVGTTAGEGSAWTSTDFETYPCFFPLTEMDPDLILISILLTPDCIRDHLSFNRIASFCFSSGDMSGLIILLSSMDTQLERTEITSIARLSLSKRGLGRPWSFLYFPSLRQSLTELALMSSSTLHNTE